MTKATKGSENAATEKKATKGSENASGSDHYQEVDVRIFFEKKEVNGKEIAEPAYEKLKVSRPCVKITDEEAEALNHGVLHGGNTYAKMYFKP